MPRRAKSLALPGQPGKTTSCLNFETRTAETKRACFFLLRPCTFGSRQTVFKMVLSSTSDITTCACVHQKMGFCGVQSPTSPQHGIPTLCFSKGKTQSPAPQVENGKGLGLSQHKDTRRVFVTRADDWRTRKAMHSKHTEGATALHSSSDTMHKNSNFIASMHLPFCVFVRYIGTSDSRSIKLKVALDFSHHYASFRTSGEVCPTRRLKWRCGQNSGHQNHAKKRTSTKKTSSHDTERSQAENTHETSSPREEPREHEDINTHCFGCALDERWYERALPSILAGNRTRIL